MRVKRSKIRASLLFSFQRGICLSPKIPELFFSEIHGHSRPRRKARSFINQADDWEFFLGASKIHLLCGYTKDLVVKFDRWLSTLNAAKWVETLGCRDFMFSTAIQRDKAAKRATGIQIRLKPDLLCLKPEGLILPYKVNRRPHNG